MTAPIVSTSPMVAPDRPGEQVGSTAQELVGPADANAVCNGCEKSLETSGDSIVVAFGSKLWHVACFKCAKCSKPVEQAENLLLLGDGAPVCGSCSYVCTLCNEVITNEAIVTGDESFHAECFKCKSCNKRIEELVFAKTSTGLWCLECHHARLARSRKHSESKRSKTIRRADESSRRRANQSAEGVSPGLTDSSPVASPLPSSPLPSSARSKAPSLPHTPTPRTYAVADYIPPAPEKPAQRSEVKPAPIRPSISDGPTTTRAEPRSTSMSTTESSPALLSDAVSGKLHGLALLPPPSNKAANRRSGFYGAPSSTGPSSPALDGPMGENNGESGELVSSLSFYDADLLPDGSETEHDLTERIVSSIGSAAKVDDAEEEPETLASSGIIERPGHFSDSLRQSRSMPANMQASDMDVDGVEMVLAELVATKERMKDLQRKYNEVRRTSVHFVEGINAARDEVEQEAAARREAEAEMCRLREQLRQQATRLGQLDVAREQTEALQRRSTELNSSVVVIERQLASLRAERAISVAEMEGLRQAKAASVELKPDDLDARLRAIKHEHQTELDRLLGEKAALNREVDEMRQMKDLFATEAAALNATNTEMAAQNTALARKLDSQRDALFRLQQQALSLGASQSKPPPALSFLAQAESPRSSPAPSFDLPPEAASFAPVRRVEATTTMPKRFKWGKGSKPAASDAATNGISSPLTVPSPSPKPASISGGRSPKLTQHSNGPSSRTIAHSMQPVSILRPQRCEACNEKMWGAQERCVVCGMYYHARCSGQRNGICPGPSTTSSYLPASHSTAPSSDQSRHGLFGRSLAAQCAAEDSAVPRIVQACIDAVERRGMDYEGIYRKSGGTSQIRTITMLFEAEEEFDLDDDDRFFDVSSVTSVLKNYFRLLPDCLFTCAVHEELMALAGVRDDPSRQLQQLRTALARLPAEHAATLRLLMDHLHRVVAQVAVNKMTSQNLGVVFGPTLLRTNDSGSEFRDLNLRARIVELCVENAPSLWQ